MAHQCAKCEKEFEQDGLEVTLHNQCILKICPECLANANAFTMTVSRRAPGRPFKLVLLETEVDSLFTE